MYGTCDVCIGGYSADLHVLYMYMYMCGDAALESEDRDVQPRRSSWHPMRHMAADRAKRLSHTDKKGK